MLEEIKQIIGEFADCSGKRITESSNLRNELGLNSLDLINIAVEVERKYGTPIEDRKLPSIKTVGDLIACV